MCQGFGLTNKSNRMIGMISGKQFDEILRTDQRLEHADRSIK